MPHVFISYVREDQHEVDRLCALLRQHGIHVWVDREQIRPGQRWKQAIRSAIENGAFFIACFSNASMVRDRSYMNEELTLAIEELRRRPTSRSWLIPVILSGSPMPERNIGGGETLHDLQWVNLAQDWGEGVSRIVDAIQTASYPVDKNSQSCEEIRIVFETRQSYPILEFTVVNNTPSAVQLSALRIIKAAEVLDDHSAVKHFLGPRTRLDYSLSESSVNDSTTIFGHEQVSQLAPTSFEAFSVKLEAVNVVALIDIEIDYIRADTGSASTYLSPSLVAVHTACETRQEDGAIALIKRKDGLQWFLEDKFPPLWTGRNYSGCCVPDLLIHGAAYFCRPYVSANLKRLKDSFGHSSAFPVIMMSVSSLLAWEANNAP